MGSDVESLKAAFSNNTYWAEWAAFAVFIGLIADIAVIIVFDLRDKDKSWREITLAGIGALVIAAGVWGESHFGHRATEAASRLQANSEKQIAALGVTAATLNKEAAAATERAATAELEIAKLAVQTGRRTLDEKKFLELLKDTPSKLAIRVWYKPNNEEPHRFAQQIAIALNKAPKWRDHLEDIDARPIPPETGYDGAVEVVLRCWENRSSMSVEDSAASGALQYAVNHSQGERVPFWADHPDSSLKEGQCRLVVGEEGGKE